MTSANVNHIASSPSSMNEKTDGGAGYGYGLRQQDQAVSVTGPTDGATEHRYVYDTAGNLNKGHHGKGLPVRRTMTTAVSGRVYTYDFAGKPHLRKDSVYIRDGSVRYASPPKLTTKWRAARRKKVPPTIRTQKAGGGASCHPLCHERQQAGSRVGGFHRACANTGMTPAAADPRADKD